mgnify:CR=1 FL=1
MIKEIRFFYNNKSILVTKEEVEWYNHCMKVFANGSYMEQFSNIDEYYAAHNTDKDMMCCIADNKRVLALAFRMEVA